MNKSTLTRERLEQLANFKGAPVTRQEEQELARMALAAMGSEPVAYTDERNLGYIGRGRETAYLWGKQNSDASDVALYRHAQPAVDSDFIPKNLDKALGVVGVAIPESREEFNLQTERWIQRLIDRVIRYADEFQEQSTLVVPDEVTAEDCPAFVKYDVTEVDEAWALGFNACRAAVLQAGTLTSEDAKQAEPVTTANKLGNSPVIPDGSEHCPCCGKKLRRACSVEGCGGKHVAHGLCKKHYDMKRWEDPEQVRKLREAGKRYRRKTKSAAAAPQEVK